MEKNNNEKLKIDNWKSKMSEGWVWRRLENCVDILDYLRVPVNSEERKKRKGNIPYYGATGQIGWIDDYLFDEELVLLGEDGAPFFDKFKEIAYIISGKSWVNNHAHVLRALSSITSNHFICHYLNQFDFHGYVTGTTRSKLNQSAMRRIPIPLPPLPEQRLIVYRVEKLLERVRKAKENLDKVPQIIKRFRQAALKKAFSGELITEWRGKHPDLEPATKLLKRIQDNRKKRYEVDHESHENTRKTRKRAEGKKTLKRLKYLESESLDNSGLPELPEGWLWCRLGEVAMSIEYGYTEKAQNSPIGPKFLRITDIQNGIVNWEEVPYCKTPKESKNYYLSPGDILVARTGATTGKHYLVKQCPEAIFASYLIRLRITGHVLSEFVSKFMDSNLYWRQIVEVQKGTAQPGANATILSNLAFPLPSLHEQKEIVRRIETLFKFADEVEKKVEKAGEKIENITQSVLSKAFRGELTGDFRKAVKNWKRLELEKRKEYIFILPESEQEKVLYADEFPLESVDALPKHVHEKNTEQKVENTKEKEPKQLTLWNERP